MRKDWIAGLVLLAVAAGYYRVAVSIPRSALSDVVGAGSFPRLLAVILAVLSTILFLEGVLKPAPSSSAHEAGRPAAEARAFARAGGTLLIGVAFLLVVSALGYPLAVAALILAMLLYNREALSAKVVITAAAGGLFFWLMFAVLFGIPVPRGIWPTLLHL